MKKVIPVFVLTILSVSLSFGQSRKYDHTIEILDNVMPTEDRHVKDLFVVREENMYTVLFYTNIHKGQKASQVAIHNDEPYTHISYSWLSGRKVAVRLFDINSSNEFVGNIFGLRCGSGMEFEIEDDDEATTKKKKSRK